MRLISCFLLLFVVGCSSATERATETKDSRHMFENGRYIWENMPSPDPAYVCYRYTFTYSTAINERTHVVCLDKSKVTHEVKDCD